MTSVVLAASSAAFEQRVRRALGGELNGSLLRLQADFTPEDPMAATKRLAAETPDVVAIGPKIDVESALEIAKAIEEERPEIGVVIVAEPNPELWLRALRSGVSDVLVPDAEDAQIRLSFERLLEAANRRRQNLATGATTESTVGKVITVIAPKGGSGKTALVTNLAAGLHAAHEGSRVAVIDLDLQFGDVGNAMGLNPEHTIADLVKVPGGITSTTLKVFMTRRSDNLYALCAPMSPAEGEEVPESVVGKSLRLLSREFDFIVVDTPAGLSEATLAAIELSTDLVLLSDLSASSLRGLRKVIDAIDQLGMTEQNRHFVLNRSDSRVGITAEEAAVVVGMPIDVEIPSSRFVPLAMNRGVPVVEDAPRSPVAHGFQSVAARFVDLTAETRKKSFGFRRDR